MNVPKLRFNNFDGYWKQVQLLDIASFSKGSLLSKSNISDEGIECILYGELYTTYSELICTIKSKTNVNADLLKFAKENDILIPSSGESAIDIATASCVKVETVACGGDLNIITPIIDDGLFLSYQLNNSKKNSIARIAQGASVVHVYNEGLKKIKVDLPTIAEQQKIVDFLSLVDQKIELQEKKIALLKDYKKGLVDKIKASKYEQVQLKTLCSQFNSNRTLSSTENLSGMYPIYDANGVLTYIDNYDIDNEYVSIIKDGAGVGRLNKCEKKSSTIATLSALVPSSCSIDYLYLVLEMVNFKKFITGSTIPHIYFKDYSNEYVPFPNVQTQYDLARMNNLILKKIEKSVICIQQIKQLKSSLLQQMFI